MECYVRHASDFIFGEDFQYDDFQLFIAHILLDSYNFFVILGELVQMTSVMLLVSYLEVPIIDCCNYIVMEE